MQHKQLLPEFLNQIAAYIDASDADLEDLRGKVQPDAFGALATHVWSHIPCLKRRLAVLTARGDEEADELEH